METVPFFGMLQSYLPLSLLGVAAVTLTIGFWGAPLWLWSAWILGTIFGFGFPEWALFSVAGVLAVFNVPALRQILVSNQVMLLLKKLQFIPNISETEKTALQAGVVWAEAELFSGKPNWERLRNEPYPDLTPEEQAYIDGPVEKLCAMTNDFKDWETRELSQEAWAFIKREKFFGMIIPKEYGGLGFSATAHSAVIKKLASRSIPTCVTVMVPNSLGPAELLIHYGTDAQKKAYLPKLATGEEVPCFALTEPTAGSDAGAMTSEGTLFKGPDGKLYMKLNWNKRWITLAAISTTLGLAFRLKDPDNILGKGPDLGITCALIPSKTPGVVLGRRHDPLGVPFYNCPTQGKDVVVSVDTIVGGIEGAGRGWKMLMECLAAGRGISLPAQSCGGAAAATRVVSNHALIRKQFGISIARLEGVEEPLARIAAYNYLMEAFRRYTLGALDQHIKPPVVTAIAKYAATELGRKMVNDSMDIMGGAGISRGPRNMVAHLHIATPIGITVEGANILTRTLIIFGQGALRAHPFAFKEVDALEKGDHKAFDRAFWGHIGHIVRNTCRSVVLSLSRGMLASSPVSGPTARYYRKLSWASASFAILADVAMGSLGGALKMKEKLTGRFADILSWMYISTAVLRRFEAEGSKEEDLPIVHYCLNHGLVEIQSAFDGIFRNLKVPGLTWLFRGPLLVWSHVNGITSPLNDKFSREIALLVTTDSAQRDRWTAGIYYPKHQSEFFFRQEETFRAILRAEGIEKRIRKAVRDGQVQKAKGPQLIANALKAGVINDAEAQELKKSEELRYAQIQVDDFSEDEYHHRVPNYGDSSGLGNSGGPMPSSGGDKARIA